MPISAIIGGVSSIFGSGLSYKGQKEANKTNIELAQQGRQHDIDMWERQNAYNTPEMQMQRLREAGLNPNLMYGSGQASTGNADAPKPAHVATTSNELASFNANNAIQMLGAYQDWQVKKAQIKNINAETEAKQYANTYQSILRPSYGILAENEMWKSSWDKDIAHANSLSRWQDWETKMLQYRRDKEAGAFEARAQLPGARLNESKERLQYLRRQVEQKDLQIQLDEQLKPYGMSTADELWQRKLVPLIEDLISPQKWIKKQFKRR